MSGLQTSGEFELKVLIAVVGGSATGKQMLAVLEAACDGIGGTSIHRRARSLTHPEAEHALERSDWLQPEFDAHDACGAIIADAKAACIHVYRNDDLIGGPRNLVDLSLEPIPFTINATAPDLFKAILKLNVLARFAHILRPGPESLTEITYQLAKPPVANNQPIAAHQEFAGDVASVLSGLFGGDHPVVPDRNSADYDDWPAELEIAARNNRANLLLFKARTEPPESDARREFIVRAKDGLALARERAEAKGASPYKLAIISANYATAVSRLAELSSSDQAEGFIAEALKVLRGCLSGLPPDQSYDRPRIQLLLNYANVLASYAHEHRAKAVTDRILALRQALKLFDGKQPGKHAEVRRELAAALLDRPGISRQASFREAVPHFRAASTLYNEAIERAVWIDDKVFFMTNLANTEILLGQLTGKIDHIDHAINALSALKDILSAAGRDEECRKVEALTDGLLSQGVRLETPGS